MPFPMIEGNRIGDLVTYLLCGAVILRYVALNIVNKIVVVLFGTEVDHHIGPIPEVPAVLAP